LLKISGFVLEYFSQQPLTSAALAIFLQPISAKPVAN
jgi:hypothetical protein